MLNEKQHLLYEKEYLLYELGAIRDKSALLGLELVTDLLDMAIEDLCEELEG